MSNYKKLISISGSVHSGKTTVSRLLAEEYPDFYYLDGDLLSHYVGRNYPPDTPIDKKLPEIHSELVDICEAIFKDGESCGIIIDFPLTDEIRHKIIEAVGLNNFTPLWFLLKPDISKVLTGSTTRPELNEWEIERIKYHYGSDLMKTNLAIVIDSTKQTPVETVAAIRAIIESR